MHDRCLRARAARGDRGAGVGRPPSPQPAPPQARDGRPSLAHARRGSTLSAGGRGAAGQGRQGRLGPLYLAERGPRSPSGPLVQGRPRRARGGAAATRREALDEARGGCCAAPPGPAGFWFASSCFRRSRRKFAGEGEGHIPALQPGAASQRLQAGSSGHPPGTRASPGGGSSSRWPRRAGEGAPPSPPPAPRSATRAPGAQGSARGRGAGATLAAARGSAAAPACFSGRERARTRATDGRLPKCVRGNSLVLTPCVPASLPSPEATA